MTVAAALLCTATLRAANPYLPLWEFIPDGEPHLFEDPDAPGKMRVYLFGSHDTRRRAFCGVDQVVWSAPADDPRSWRFEGVAFRSITDGNGKRFPGHGDALYAPDVAQTVAPDGTKTYWLYPNNVANGRRNMIAKSDRPAGPYAVCNWTPGKPECTYGCIGFDPSVFIDDDGRAYAYWGGSRCVAAELDPATMCTVKPGTKAVKDFISGWRSPGVFRFYEASSMRKISGKYVFVYSRWTEDGEFGLPASNYTLAYAYSDGPLGPFKYGGTIIDGRGREKRPDGTVVFTAHPTGNTHGGLCKLAGRWWVFYHRQTGLTQFTRQAMVAPVTVEVEDGPGGAVRISEAELTSEGFETDGLDPFERHAGGIACHYTGRVPAKSVDKLGYEFSGPYPEPTLRPIYYGEKDFWAANVNRCRMVHVTDGSVVGYKYFDFSRTRGRKGLALEMRIEPHGFDATVEVWVGRPCAEEGGRKVGEFAISSKMRKRQVERISAPLPALAEVSGRQALYFIFSSPEKTRTLCYIEDFRFVSSP